MGCMNLYLISQEENNGYDTYDSAVVFANNEDEARNTNPSTGCPMEWEDTSSGIPSWCRYPESVKVELLGVAIEGSENGVICSSFNAG
jgi:hypothetical protein